MIIRAVEPHDAEEWLRMRRLLWPGEGHDVEIEEHFLSPVLHVLVSERSPDTLAGFIEIGLRPYAEGCNSSPVPFIEGWFVDSDVRGQRVGEALMRAAEAWARSEGFTEIASDVELENETSIAAHRALGFAEVTRLVCFRLGVRRP